MSKQNLLRTLFGFSLGPVSAAALAVVTTPIITWIIVPDEFAKATLFNTSFNMLFLISFLGLEHSFVRFFNSRENGSHARLLSTSIAISMACCSLIFILLMIFWRKFSLLLFNEVLLVPIIMLGLTLCVGTVGHYGLLTLRMQQRSRMYSLVVFLRSATNAITTIGIALFVTKTFIAIIAGVLISFTVTAILTFLLNRSLFSGIKEKVSSINVRELFSFGLPLIPSSLLFWVFQSTDRFSLRWLSDFEQLGLYAMAFKIVAIVDLVKKTFVTFWIPVAYKHYQENPVDTNLYKRAFSAISAVMFLVILSVLLLKEPFILLLHPDYQDSAEVLPFLLFAPMMYTLSEVTALGINFTKKTTWHLIISLVVSCVNLIGNILLVPVLGARGAAISTGSAYVLFFILRTGISMRYFRVEFKLYKPSIIIFFLVLYSVYLTLFPFSALQIITGLLLVLLVLYLYRADYRYMMKKIIKEVNSGRRLSKRFVDKT